MKYLKIILAMVTLLLVTSKVEAAQMTGGLLTLGDSRPEESTSHVYAFTHPSAETISSITFQYCLTPSGTCGSPSTDITAVSLTAETLPGDDWTVTQSGSMITITSPATAGFTAQYASTVEFGTIVNPALSDGCDGSTTDDRDTCFVRIISYDGATPIDTTVLTYTILSAVTVSAKVDPTFTFVVSAVDLNTVHGGITTSVTSTALTLPFGSLLAGTPKYAAHGLSVTTNTQGGYTITTGLVSRLTGAYAANNIDPFVAPWTAPTTWTEPTGGTPNDNTGWFGANITDTDVSNWGTPTGLFGGVALDTSVTVAKKLASDNGLTPDYITYAIEANVFQPSDTYQGTLIYNALPTY